MTETKRQHRGRDSGEFILRITVTTSPRAYYKTIMQSMLEFIYYKYTGCEIMVLKVNLALLSFISKHKFYFYFVTYVHMSLVFVFSGGDPVLLLCVYSDDVTTPIQLFYYILQRSANSGKSTLIWIDL